MSSTEEETKILSEKVLNAVGISASVLLADLGFNSGIFDALAASTDPQTAAELAKRSGLVERYVADWLSNQVAAGFVSLVRPIEEPPRFFLSDAQKRVFVQLENPSCQVAFLHMLTGLSANIVNRLPTDFKEGKGFAFGDNHPLLFKVKELMIRKNQHQFDAHFIAPVVEAFPNRFKERLMRTQKGAPLVVVDVACGSGFLLKEFHKRYPSNLYIGLDNHLPFLENAGLEEGNPENKNPLFALADAHAIPSLCNISGAAAVWNTVCPNFPNLSPLPSKVDVFILTDALHDLSDPLAALISMREQLVPDGVIVVREPGNKDPRLDAIAGSTDPMPLLWSAAGVCVCGPATMGGRADGVACTSHSLGTVAPDSTYFAIGERAGFSDTVKVVERLFRFEN